MGSGGFGLFKYTLNWQKETLRRDFELYFNFIALDTNTFNHHTRDLKVEAEKHELLDVFTITSAIFLSPDEVVDIMAWSLTCFLSSKHTSVPFWKHWNQILNFIFQSQDGFLQQSCLAVQIQGKWLSSHKPRVKFQNVQIFFFCNFINS